PACVGHDRDPHMTHSRSWNIANRLYSLVELARPKGLEPLTFIRRGVRRPSTHGASARPWSLVMARCVGTKSGCGSWYWRHAGDGALGLVEVLGSSTIWNALRRAEPPTGRDQAVVVGLAAARRSTARRSSSGSQTSGGKASRIASVPGSGGAVPKT